ncbi:ferritin [Tenacibaculum tangerinum]|uniref:Ferritin n=1 Tax=Tenacibaculum tangerinum TaxID=3038772 RepID=A0ABY8L0Y4_9FLAO|nr:ferritin [Tenacibaculum tangerinum]WGH75128.1 ferritin [Tenacibaculum tangerinum]
MITYKNISKKMETALNEQLTTEAVQAQNYLSYASWAEVNGYQGFSKFLYKHSVEERNHMYKILRYINDRGGRAKIETIAAPAEDPKDIKACIEAVMKHEMDNTAAINKLVSLAQSEGDWASYNFLQWFVKEQIEEEALIKKLVDGYNIIEQSKKSGLDLVTFDLETGTMGQDATIPREKHL